MDTTVKLKFEFSQEVVDQLLSVLNQTKFSGIESAQSLLNIVQLLKTPLNIDELEKSQMETLKQKYEPKKEEKK